MGLRASTLSQKFWGVETILAGKKRKRDDDLNEFLPDHAPDDGESYGSLEFNEILDEEVSST